jgi:diguanylate cyclase (GGDEF)-like protein
LRQGLGVAGAIGGNGGGEPASAGSSGDAAARKLAREVSSLQATLLGRLHEEMAGSDAAPFAAAAQRLAEEFGSVTATAVGALWEGNGAEGGERGDDRPEPADPADRGRGRRAGLYRDGEMRHRLEQLIESHRRYGHPFGLVVFDVEGPGARNGGEHGGRDTVLTVASAALRESVRLVDESFRLGDEGLCVLAPSQTTVGGVQMAERLLAKLDELEAAGGLRISVAAGVVACPEHGHEAEGLLRRADEAMWRAQAVGQPVGVGSLDGAPLQDR